MVYKDILPRIQSKELKAFTSTGDPRPPLLTQRIQSKELKALEPKDAYTKDEIKENTIKRIESP